MQKQIAILLLVLSTFTLNAQKDRPRNLTSFDFKKLHWGFTVGVNSMDFSLKRNYEAADFLYADADPGLGFQVNIVSDLRLSDNWNLRFLPGINLGDRFMNYFDPSNNYTQDFGYIDATEGSGSLDNDRMVVKSAFLDFPLLFKYRSIRVNNARPYLVGGLSYRLDLAADKEASAYTINRTLTRKSDVYLEVGFGIDTYLQYFKFAPEMKLCIGLLPMLNPRLASTPYETSISDLHSFLVMINFHFE